jgi:multiple sugar transport system substrate-binding protein
MNTSRTRSWMALAGTAAVAIASLTACGSGSDNSSSGPLDTISVWDPYPQYDNSSDWAKYVQSCAPEGVTVKRTAAPTGDLLNKLTSAVKEGNAPAVAILDNPAVPDAASAGLLAPSGDVGFTTTGFDKNIAGPGTVDGTTYGVPIGANTLGLYYNADILKKAGVDPATLTSWGGLNDALAKVTAAGSKGITFAGIAGEEGVFQFLPWFWGAGADLADPGSAEATEAGSLLSGWIRDGYAPKSAITDNQSASWDLFLTGEYAFAENGSWFAKDAEALTDFKAVMTPIPAKDGGAAPAPTGGEFLVAPLQKDDSSQQYAAAKQVIDCLVAPDKQVATDDQLGYFAPNADERGKQIAAQARWAPWVDSIDNAQGRTTDLGAAYTATSAAISTALQASLNAAGDENAVKSAFKQAGQDAKQ